MVQKVEAGDGRQRQGRRDEQLRKKLQAEINKRKRAVGQTTTPRKRVQGSVMALKPLAPVTMEMDTTIYEASQYMSAKRANCVLVLDGDGAVCGIFTAKDIAFKVVGQGKDARSTKIRDIMTPNPTVANINTSATDALNLMVERGFRHLPVVDDEGDIAGVLDITKCFYEAMQKLERAYESSRKLQDALEGVKSEFGGGNQPAQIMSYVEALRERTAGPDLSSVLDGRQPVYVDVRTNVAAVAGMMRENRTTAVLVTDNSAITGIFTTKDIALRVLAAGLDPAKVSVVRVMTPQPDSAPISMSIQDALRKMHDGHYLNLPVMDTDGAVVGVVDVLKLTYATLEQINTLSSGESGEGPAWNKFWLSLDETESVHSDSHLDSSSQLGIDTGNISASASELAQFSLPDGAELAPEDSLSRAGQHHDFPMSQHSEHSISTAVPETYPFKFKAPQGRVHRINVSPTDGLEIFRRTIAAKLSDSELMQLGGLGKVIDEQCNGGFAISYIDEDGDTVSITASDDLTHAVRAAQHRKSDKVDLYLHSPENVPEVRAAGMDPMIPALIAGGVAAIAIIVFAFRGKK